MPHTKSAAKRMRQSERRRLANKTKGTAVKTAMRKLQETIARGEKDKAKEMLPQVLRRIDKAAKAGVLKGNTASRRKSLAARRVAALGS
jgi:small subunit ribosomal protein S20